MVEILWLCGPSGVGKSSVGYALFEQLGPHAAYVDLDQLGLCHPAPADDPGNHRLKARNLGGVHAGFRAAGTRQLVISGLVDDAAGVASHVARLPGADVTVCRLRADTDQLRARFERRGWLLNLLEESVRNGRDLDRTDFADLVVDTSGLAVPEVVAKVRATGWPPPAPAPLADAPPAELPAVELPAVELPAAAGGSVLFLCGPPAVGKSTVGFEVYLRKIGADVPVAYVDLAQIGFCRPAPPDGTLTAHNLGRVWAGHRAAGASHLIVTGNVTDRAALARYRAAIPAADWIVCRLRADAATLTERVMLRGRGGGPGIMGDDLRGRPEAELRGRAADIVRTAGTLDASALGDVAVDTDARDVAEVATLVEEAWPGGGICRRSVH
ncbi:AAA family ATPase [Virgisporangium aurantiacum]|uniref:Adenylylsulfate kinase n=1 Tax=Virgisporangium aurantiacum TaxID=175570 RepID=A0A8J3ZFY8_9ACTN|nr:AAA family ATPase [Virgisporangium aurantiacum]GIJ60890.1 hypothetical protein Vau01_084060 [Virgisporangium aurantiacum]